MDRSYVTVHVGADTRARIRDRTDPGESVEDWVRDAIHRRLDGDGEQGRGGDADDASRHGDPIDDDTGYEFVDDCGV